MINSCQNLSPQQPGFTLFTDITCGPFKKIKKELKNLKKQD